MSTQTKGHIVIVLYFNAPMGGLHLNVLDSVHFLIKNGFEVSVISKSGIFSEKVQELDANAITIDFDIQIPYTLDLIINQLETSPTLVHTHPFKAKDFAIELSKHYNVPLVMTQHSINDKYIHRYAKYVDVFIAVSDLVRDFIISQGIESCKVFTIYNGVELDLENFSNNEQKPKNLLSVSRYDKDKLFLVNSIEFALKKILDEEKFDFYWTIVGSGSELEKLRCLSEKINIKFSKRVIRLLGYKEPTDLFNLYKEHDVFIGPGRGVIDALNNGNIAIAVGSKGYVGIVDEDRYLEAIYTNFGGDRKKLDERLLWKDLNKVFTFSKKKIESTKQLSKKIAKTFFNLQELNQKLLNLYETISLVKPNTKKIENEIISLKKQLFFNNENYFLKGNGKLKYNENSISIQASESQSILYLIAGSKNINSLPIESFRVNLINTLDIELEAKVGSSKLLLFIIEFDELKKIVTKSYSITNGYNLVNHKISLKTKFLKVAFRVSLLDEASDIDIKKINLLKTERTNYIPSLRHIENPKKLYIGEYTYSFIDRYMNYNFYANIKKGKKVIISFCGAVDRNKRVYDFQRYSWSNDIDYSWITILDPTINESNNLKIGWYQGHQKEFALKSIVEKLKKLFFDNKIDERDVTFFGSSAGGFASLMMGNYFLKSKVIVLNPQVYVENYFKTPVSDMMQYVFDDDVKERYKDRLNVNIDFLKRDAKIYYIQNRMDNHHYSEHLNVYLKNIHLDDYSVYDVDIEMLENVHCSSKLNILVYDDKETGHTPPNKETTLNVLKCLIGEH